MKWFANIKDLQYYTQPKGVSCYCEQLVYPSDMLLQGTIPAGQGSGNYNISIEVWSPDGLTIYEVANSYFDYYFAVNPVTSLHYFNARLRSFSPAMCSHQCFLIRVGITNVGDPNNYLFANWTERWCVSDCCDTARGIVIAQAGMVSTGGGSSTGTTTVPASASKPMGECGEPLIRIISSFDCIDKFTGEYYGDPGTVLSGSASFNYTKITSMKGRIVRRPREIKKEISYNCKIQRVESTPLYLLEGFEYFPDWKMYEIEGQLHANHIWVDDYNTYREYRYDGGTPFKQVHKCFELFKLEAMMQDCTQRQIFGCAPCDNTAGSMYYMIPASYSGGAFYADNGTLMANDYDGLLLYYNSLYGAVAEDADTTGMSCDVYKLMKVSGYAVQQQPFYFDAPLSANKVYGRVVTSTEELCAGLGPVCIKPVAGTPVVADMVCAAPVAGTVTITDNTPLSIALTALGNWVAEEALTYASLYRNEVRFSIKLTNNTITEDPDAPGESVDILNEPIAVIGAAARPYAIAVLSNDNNTAIPDGLIITIDAHGIVRASGPCTGATPTNVTIELTDIVYNI